MPTSRRNTVAAVITKLKYLNVEDNDEVRRPDFYQIVETNYSNKTYCYT